jgi:hypothetical protein
MVAMSWAESFASGSAPISKAAPTPIWCRCASSATRLLPSRTASIFLSSGARSEAPRFSIPASSMHEAQKSPSCLPYASPFVSPVASRSRMARRAFLLSSSMTLKLRTHRDWSSGMGVLFIQPPQANW